MRQKVEQWSCLKTKEHEKELGAIQVAMGASYPSRECARETMCGVASKAGRGVGRICHGPLGGCGMGTCL